MQTEHLHQPGDVVNGHQLSADGTTREPVAAAQRANWFARHKIASALMAGLAGLLVLGAMGGGAEPSAVGDPVIESAQQQQQPQTAPVPEPEDAPAPAPQEAPTFAPITYSGSGDTVQSLEIPNTDAGHVMVTVTHGGTSNIAVWSVDGDLNQTDLLVNEIGAYQGSTIIPADTSGLSIGADGAWTVTVDPISSAPTFSDSYAGSGPAVVVYTGGKAVADISHTGESNFSVRAYPERGFADLLVNEVGNYSGQSIVPAGPAVLVVSADGPWTITAE